MTRPEQGELKGNFIKIAWYTMLTELSAPSITMAALRDVFTCHNSMKRKEIFFFQNKFSIMVRLS